MTDRKGHIKKIQQLINYVKNNAATEAATFAADAFALVKNRIIQTGIDGDGAKIPGYSEAVVPFWYFKGRGRKKDTADRLLKKKGYFVSYKDFRQFDGLQTDHVDFFVKGNLWGSFEFLEISRDQQKIVIIATPDDALQKKILGYLIEQKGDWLKLSKEEERLLADIAAQRQVKIFKQFGL